MLCFVSLPVAEAVIVYGTNGAGSNNTSAPGDDPGWANVGTVGGATAVYLGSQTTGFWMLTANHVDLSSGTVALNGGNYTILGSATQIGTADLKVFRLLSDPSLPGVTIANTAPTSGTSVTMIGNGRGRGAQTTWDGNPAGWGSPGPDAEGYAYGTSQIVRWGTNAVQANSLSFVSGTTTFSTIFNNTSNANEAQASLGDSGGAVFSKSTGVWELTGTMIAVGVWTGSGNNYGANFIGQPSDTVVHSVLSLPNGGSATFSVQLSTYRSAILAAIPEPSTYGLLVIGGLFAAWRIRRRTADQR